MYLRSRSISGLDLDLNAGQMYNQILNLDHNVPLAHILAPHTHIHMPHPLLTKKCTIQY